MLRYAGDWYGCRDVVFELAPDVTVGVEICEDVWVADPPKRDACCGGATVLLNLSCSDEIIGKARIPPRLCTHAGRCFAAYVRDSGFSESTTDMIFAGQLDLRKRLVTERERFVYERHHLRRHRRGAPLCRSAAA